MKYPLLALVLVVALAVPALGDERRFDRLNGNAEEAYNSGDFSRCRSLLEQALDEATARQDRIARTASLERLAAVCLKIRPPDYQQSESLLREALEIRRSTLWNNHPDVIQDEYNLGVVLEMQKKMEEALPFFQAALAGDESIFGTDSKHLLDDVSHLASVERALKHNVSAEKLYVRFINIAKRFHKPNDAIFCVPLAALAFIYGTEEFHQWQKAKDTIEHCMAIEKVVYGAACEQIIGGLEFRAHMMHRLKDPAEDRAWREICELGNANPTWKDSFDCRLHALPQLARVARDQLKSRDHARFLSNLHVGMKTIRSLDAQSESSPFRANVAYEYCEFADLLCLERQLTDARKFYVRAEEILRPMPKEASAHKTVVERQSALQRFVAGAH